MKRVEAFCLVLLDSSSTMHKYGLLNSEKPVVLLPKTEVGFPPPRDITVEICVEETNREK